MRYKATHSQKANFFLSFVPIVVGLFSYTFFAVNTIPYRSIGQAVAVVLIVFGLYVFLRYQFADFYYEIAHNEASAYSDTYEAHECDFVVYRGQGERVGALCRMALSEAVLFEKRKTGWRKSETLRGKTVNYYNYCANLRPKDAYLIVFCDDCDIYHAIAFEPNEDLIRYLTDTLGN